MNTCPLECLQHGFTEGMLNNAITTPERRFIRAGFLDKINFELCVESWGALEGCCSLNLGWNPCTRKHVHKGRAFYIQNEETLFCQPVHFVLDKTNGQST